MDTPLDSSLMRGGEVIRHGGEWCLVECESSRLGFNILIVLKDISRYILTKTFSEKLKKRKKFHECFGKKCRILDPEFFIFLYFENWGNQHDAELHSGPIPAQKIRGNSITAAVFSYTMLEIDLYYSHSL